MLAVVSNRTCMCAIALAFFFFKQKTAYEMRISDWSSDVCSSDLPVAFIIVLPNINELLIDMDGSLLPFGWVRLLWWLRKPKSRTLRVPLMGVVKSLQNSRLASQLAFMMIEFIRRDAIVRYGSEYGDIGRRKSTRLNSSH